MTLGRRPAGLRFSVTILSLSFHQGIAAGGQAHDRGCEEVPVAFSFEADLHGFNSPLAQLTRVMEYATHGAHSMRVSWPAGFTWLFGGNAPGLAAMLGEDVLLADVVVAAPNPVLGQSIIAFNDPLGWRQTQHMVNIPNATGIRTIAYDHRALTPPNLKGGFLQFNFGLDAAGGPNVFHFDNIRPLADLQARTVMSFESGLHNFTSSLTIAQATQGVTAGTHAMSIDVTPGFNWLFGGGTPTLAGDLGAGQVLLIDCTVVDANPGGSLRAIISFNDSLGWRQTVVPVALPVISGTHTVAVDYRELAQPALSGSFQLNIGLESVGSIELYVDNLRVLLTCIEFALGDMNCDGIVSVGDIAGFVLALTNPAGYAAAFPGCDINLADINGDMQVSVSDIGPFVQLLTGG